MKLPAFVFFCSAVVSAQRLPEGKGKDELVKVCTPCHGAENVIGEAKTREEWGQLVGEMVSFGAQGTDEELNLIVDYLARNFPKTPKKLDPPSVR